MKGDGDRDRDRNRDRSSRRSGRSRTDYDDDDRHSSQRSSRRRDDYDEDVNHDGERRRRRDRDYERRDRDSDDRRRIRRDDGDDYYSRSRSHRDRDDGYGGDSYYGGGVGRSGGRSRYDSYRADDDHYDPRSARDRSGRDSAGGSWRDAPARESSPVLKRSPTPEGTIPISQRLRPKSKWDIHAPGFEGTSALAAKATGLFGIPGQSRTLGVPAPTRGMSHGGHGGAPPNVIIPQALPPIHLGTGGPPSGISVIPPANLPPTPSPATANNPAAPTSAKPDPNANNQNRQARRLYIGNMSPEANEANVCAFFNEKMTELNLVNEEGGDPCIGAQVQAEKGYAFVEFRSPEEATNAMSFDGIVFQSQSLKIRRPKDYVGPDVRPPPNIHVPGVISTNVPDSPNKIFVGGLPTYLTDDQVIELLKAFGELRSFNLVKEVGTGQSKGFAFCEYVDPALTDLACQGLNDMELGDRKLIVQRASIGNERRQGGGGHHGPAGTGANAGPLGNGGGHHHHLPASLRNFAASADEAGEPTRCMMMLNMVTPEELLDDEEYADIVEDIRDECAKFGRVTDVRIPRPAKESKGWAAQTWRRSQAGGGGDGGEEKESAEVEREGVGRVYVRYSEVEQCSQALKAIAGRQFGGRLVICAFLKEDDWPKDEDGGEDAGATSAQASGPRPEGEGGQGKREEAEAEGKEEEKEEKEESKEDEKKEGEEDDDGGESDMAMGDD
ncbi:hypothetical protein IE53DRAFT_30945 [Violaceomyces palustris]|uniref:Uncharacterized protein n=1 Tax=Violaceomyces palustris TaxID=1673888 RepID=A0ACD0P1A4_9BASI|nr:hypothetical protein IE53DRAFT_30945 [Violaceomyces palustris]